MLRTFEKKLLAIDPAFINTRLAIRGTASVVLSFFIISYLSKLYNQPPTLAFLGVVIALMGSMVINDPSPRQQMTTMALLPFPASLAFVTSILLGPWPPLRMTGFLITIFAAVWMRRFGPRWLAIGMVMFMAYFSPLFFPIHADAIPWVLGSVFIATILSFIMRFVIFADRTAPQLKRYLKSIDVRAELILRQVTRELEIMAVARDEDRPKIMANARERIQKQTVLLNELSLLLEQYLETSSIKSKAELLQLQIFEKELAIGHYLNTVRHAALSPLATRATYLDAAEISKILTQVILSQSSVSSHPDPAADRVIKSFRQPEWTEDAIAQVAADIETKKPALPAETLKPKLHVSTRQAIQATLATALASAAGNFVSADRWYWASISAFMVFVGASRGESLARAFVRTLGTASGLLLGFVFAYLLSGKAHVEWTLIVACLFFALFGSRMAFGFWTAAVFTTMIALLFDIMGTFSRQILFLRLEETFIGSIIGAAVAGYIFPNSTRAMVKTSLATLMRTAGEILEDWTKTTPSLFSRRTLYRKLRQLDREMKALRITTAPIVGRGSVMASGELPGILHDTIVLRHYLSHLIMSKDTHDQAVIHDHALNLAAAMQTFADHLENKPKSSPLILNQALHNSWLDGIRHVLLSIQQRKF